jgi:hypothetical protein
MQFGPPDWSKIIEERMLVAAITEGRFKLSRTM